MIALEPIWIAFLALASCNVARQILSKCTGMHDDESQSSMSTTTSEHQSDLDRIPMDSTSTRIPELPAREPTDRNVALESVLLHGETLMRTPSPCRQGIMISEPPHLKRVNHRTSGAPIPLLQRPVSDGYLEEVYRGGRSCISNQNLGRTDKTNSTLVSSRSCGDLGIRNCSSSSFGSLSLASILFRMKYPTFGQSDSFSQGERNLTPVASNKQCKVLQGLMTDGGDGPIVPQGDKAEDDDDDDEELSFYNKSVYSFGQRVLQSYDDMSFVILPESQSPSNSTLESTLNGECPRPTTTSPPPPPPCMPLRLSTEPPSSIDVHLTPSWKMERNHNAIPLVPRLRRHKGKNGSHSPCRIEPRRLPTAARSGKREENLTDESCETGVA